MFIFQDDGMLRYINPSTMPNVGILINFNKPITNALEDIDALKSKVFFSTDDGQNYNPLSEQDQVSFEGNALVVTFDKKYKGSQNVLKLLAGAVKDADENVNKEVITYSISAGPNLVFSSDTHDINVGDSIHFSIDQAETVYLVSQSFGGGNQTDYEYLVVEGKAAKRIVTESEINTDVTLDTTGLTPGRYSLQGWSGESTWINLSITPQFNINNTNFHVDNQSGTDSDSIAFSGLQPGDIVRIYTGYDLSGLITSGTVAEGSTEVTISVPLDDAGEITLYYTIQSTGKAESWSVGSTYPAKSDPPLVNDVVE
ncbi:hypothetical protein [Paenibacillus sp. DS2015]|uniref:hypothetical protein n=1 Tax=Paenibacillus sp. DS2015 TaxID=3373917 RepID=UPI003D23EB60